MDDLFAIFQRLDENVKHYENAKTGKQDPYREVLDNLQAPYGPMRNYDGFLAVLKRSISKEAARAWFAYPDFVIDTKGESLSEASRKMDPSFAGKARDLTGELVSSDLLVDLGNDRYVRNYLFGIIFDAILWPEKTPFGQVGLDWWEAQCSGDSGKLRATTTEYRIQPHQGTLDGNQIHGKIPMNLEIPDQREILPMDELDKILEAQETIAVIPCMCRLAKDRQGTRECDHPIQDTCFVFNEAAVPTIEMGYGRQISVDEAKSLVRQYRDRGLVQEISNAAHPLAMCNCCECCCLCLLSMKRYETNMAVPSRWQADVGHVENCIGCGKCAQVCFMDAISFDMGIPQVKGSLCAGCGLCAANCPKGVLKMIKRAGAQTEYGREKPERIYL